nr:zinc-binding dehydrogenase [Alicyclobacillus sacchari]
MSEPWCQSHWNYHEGSFVDFVQQHTDGRGADIIFDFIGAPYFADNIASLATDGRLIVIGTMGGSKVDALDLGQLLGRRLQVIGTALRSRSLADKIALTSAFQAFAGDALARGDIVLMVDSVFDWRDVQEAHKYMESNRNTGKIVLNVS